MSVFPLNVSVQEGKFYAHSATFGFTSLIPKSFQNTSFEAEEAAKELTLQAAKKAKAAEKAKEMAKKSAAAKQANVTSTKQKTHQKPDKDKKTTTEQTMAPALAKKDAPVKRCTVSFPSARVVLVSAALFFAAAMALRSNSSGPTGGAEVVTTKSYTKSVSSSWADASNDQQCGLYDNNDFCAVQEAFETTCSVHFPAT